MCIRDSAGLAKQIKPLGVKGAADFTYNNKNDPMQQVTVRVFQFNTDEQCKVWMKTKYEFPGWQQKYKRITEKDLTGFDSLEARKRIVCFGNLWITAGTICERDLHLTVLRLFIDRIRKPQPAGAANRDVNPAPQRDVARTGNMTANTNVVTDEVRHSEDPGTSEWPDLRLVSISPKQFLLRFDSASKAPDGGDRFGVSDEKNGRAYFQKIGGEWNGFKIVAFEPKIQKPAAPAGAPARDVSILVYQRGDKTIRLVRGEAVPYVEHIATVKIVSTGREAEVKESDSFNVATTLFTVAAIDPKAGRVRITTAASPTGKWIELSQKDVKLGAGR